MREAKLVVHSDVLLDHLRGADHPSILRRTMGLFFCYTTVFQAIEVFAGMRTAVERRWAEDAMSAMKLLGQMATFEQAGVSRESEESEVK